jgi:Fe-S oxidoreductase
MGVNFTDFTKGIRKEAFKTGKEATCTHGGALQSLMKIMTSENLNQNRMDWITDDLKVAENGEILYFVGCLPYFDAFFTELEADTLAIAKSTIRLLNALGVTPVLMKNERCCGHDLLWSGDVDNFKMLAEANLDEIEKINPKKVMFSCAECYRTFKVDYAALAGKLDFEVQHLSEFLSEHLTSNGLSLKELEEKVTFQDPCRLGRNLGVYDPPRDVLNNLPGVEFQEMAKNRQNATCCGTNSWINCDSCSRSIQKYRLKMARDTGADVLVTSCPKCYIHFNCAMQGDKFPEEEKVQIKDLAVLAAEALG